MKKKKDTYYSIEYGLWGIASGRIYGELFKTIKGAAKHLRNIGFKPELPKDTWKPIYIYEHRLFRNKADNQWAKITKFTVRT